MDTSYRWARTRYNTTQRTASFWVFALTLRARLTLMDQQWSYVGGYSDEKCAHLLLIVLQAQASYRAAGSPKRGAGKRVLGGMPSLRSPPRLGRPSSLTGSRPTAHVCQCS